MKRKRANQLYRRKDSPYFWHWYRNPWTKEKEYFNTKETDEKNAEIAAQQHRAKVLRGEITNEAKELRLFEIIDTYLPSRLKEKVVSAPQDVAKLERFKEELGDISYKEITKPVLTDFRATLEDEGLSPATVNRYFSALRKCFNWWIENERDRKAPRITLNPLEREGIFEDEEGRAKEHYLEHEEKPVLYPLMPEWMRDMTITAVKTGMRQGEQLGLPKTAINFNAADLFLQGKSNARRTKSGKSRHVPLPPEVVLILKKWFARYPKSPYVFCDENGDKFSRHGIFRTTFEDCVKRAETAKGAKIRPGLTWHSLRHTYGKELGELNTHPRLMMELMGHSSMKMVMRYTHFSKGEKRRIVDSLRNDSSYALVTEKFVVV